MNMAVCALCASILPSLALADAVDRIERTIEHWTLEFQPGVNMVQQVLKGRPA